MLDYSAFKKDVQNAVITFAQDFKSMKVIKFKYNIEDTYLMLGDFIIYITGDELRIDTSKSAVNLEYTFYRINDYGELVLIGSDSRLFSSAEMYKNVRDIRNSLMMQLKNCFDRESYAKPSNPNFNSGYAGNKGKKGELK